MSLGSNTARIDAFLPRSEEEGISFFFTCPWCGNKGKYQCHNLESVAVSPSAIFIKREEALTNLSRIGRLFLCTNPRCWSPVEAVVCESGKAKGIQQILQGETWFGPRRVPLLIAVDGEESSSHTLVMFNRRPVNRWAEIRLSELIEVDVAAKFLWGATERLGIPVTLFEAWAAKRDGNTKVFWIPVEPDLAAAKTPHPVPLSPNYRHTCSLCRARFDGTALNTFRITRPCPYATNCPAANRCDKEPIGPKWIARCLQWLDFREEISPCYQSDLCTLRQLANDFVKKPDQAVLRTSCWAGYTECAFPVVVHEHLVGIVMTGQYDSESSPTTPSEFTIKEREWHREHNPALQSESLLATAAKELQQAIDEDKQRAPHSEIGECLAALQEDVNNLTSLGAIRYSQSRNLSEVAFLRELHGELTNRL